MALPGVLSSIGFSASGKSMRQLLKLASESNRVLVMIYLEGGNDGLNTVVPLDRLSALNAVRPHVVLPESSLLELPGTEIGLHPAMTGFEELFKEDRLAIAQNVGYPDQNFSHFRSTDIWMSGSGSNELVTSGWTGRYLAETNPEYPEDYPDDADPLAIELGYGASLLLQGPAANMGMVIQDPDSFYQLIDSEQEPTPDTPAGDKLKYIRLIKQQSQQFGEIVRDAASSASNAATYPQTRLAENLKIVSRLIEGGLTTPVYLVRIGGFDTHEGQVNPNDHTQGWHNDLLTELDGAVSAFMKDLEMLGNDDRVVGMTFSEFGRRVVSNASVGTDHGSAAPMFFFGNAVKRQIHGANPYIDATMNYQYNMPMEFDFRQLYASIMDQWLGVPDATISNVLFDNFNTLEIIGEDVVLDTPKISENNLKVYPNPLNGQAQIEIISDGRPMSIRLIDLTGKMVANIYHGTLPAGYQKLHWNTSAVKSGRYFVVKHSTTGKSVVSVVK